MIRFSGVYSMMGKWSELCVEEEGACDWCMWVVGVETLYKASGCVNIPSVS